MKLTKTYIDGITYTGSGKSGVYHWDDRVPGFGIRVLPSGTKNFVFKYRMSGRIRWANLGRFGAITLHQALQMARDRYIALKSGKDPKAEADNAPFKNATVSDLGRYFMENYSIPKKKSWDRDQRTLDKWIKPKLGKMLVREVRRQHIARFHNEVGKEHPIQANRAKALLSTMFNQATNWGFLPEDAKNPTDKVDSFPENERERFVERSEMPRLAAAINRRPQDVRTMIWLYLFTGLRKSELMKMRWSDVDLAGGRIKIRHPKRGSTHYLPLPSASIKLLEDMPRFHDNPHVFPGARLGDHRKDFRRHWEKIREEAGVEDLWIHDLRRTVGSYMAQEGHSLAIIGRVLNHTNPKTTQRYARLSDAPVRQALEDHSKVIEAVIEGEVEGEVAE